MIVLWALFTFIFQANDHDELDVRLMVELMTRVQIDMPAGDVRHESPPDPVVIVQPDPRVSVLADLESASVVPDVSRIAQAFVRPE